MIIKQISHMIIIVLSTPVKQDDGKVQPGGANYSLVAWRGASLYIKGEATGGWV